MQKKKIIGCLIVIFLVVGCASNRFAVQSPTKTQFRDFDSLEINDFKTNVIGSEAQDVADSMASTLKEKIIYHNTNSEDKLFGDIVIGDSSALKPLIADCTLISYEKGSRAARYFIGFGAGEAFTTVSCSFIDKNTSNEISAATFDGELSIGFFGGSVSEASSAMINSIVEYIEVNY